MKYIKPFSIILFISYLGDLCGHLLPFPIPGGIYGILIMLILLSCKVLRAEDVKPAVSFLIEIMPLMFIPAAVGLMSTWGIIRANLTAYIVIVVSSTVVVMAAAGRMTQFILHRHRKGETP